MIALRTIPRSVRWAVPLGLLGLLFAVPFSAPDGTGMQWDELVLGGVAASAAWTVHSLTRRMVSRAARPWRVVATGIVNRTLGEAAWTLDSDSLKGGRTLNVVYAANNDLTHLPGQTVRVQSSLTGRNTSYGYPANVCQTTPSG